MFGQNRTKSRQFVTKIKDFVRELLHSKDGDLLYLSTQQPDETEEKSTSFPPPPFTVPCRQLLQHKLIPETLSWAGHLKLQSCNLWMGGSISGSCSGLHHDYHDNFYLLFQGRKKFRLFSPDMAATMYTHGTIECIHPNGLISHYGHETRADGVPLELLEQENEAEESNVGDDKDDDEEEIVIGKGFDDKSESEEEDGF
jgi:hypothetical protein